MLKSEIATEARAIIKDIFWKLATREEYKEAIRVVTEEILPRKIGADKFVWQQVQRDLTNKFGKLFIKKNKDV